MSLPPPPLSYMFSVAWEGEHFVSLWSFSGGAAAQAYSGSDLDVEQGLSLGLAAERPAWAGDLRAMGGLQKDGEEIRLAKRRTKKRKAKEGIGAVSFLHPPPLSFPQNSPGERSIRCCNILFPLARVTLLPTSPAA